MKKKTFCPKPLIAVHFQDRKNDSILKNQVDF